jgi:hypothetical protein
MQKLKRFGEFWLLTQTHTPKRFGFEFGYGACLGMSVGWMHIVLAPSHPQDSCILHETCALFMLIAVLYPHNHLLNKCRSINNWILTVCVNTTQSHSIRFIVNPYFHRCHSLSHIIFDKNITNDWCIHLFSCFFSFVHS